MPNPRLNRQRPVSDIAGDSIARYYQAPHHYDAGEEYVTPEEASMDPDQARQMVKMRRHKESEVERAKAEADANEEAAEIEAARLAGEAEAKKSQVETGPGPALDDDVLADEQGADGFDEMAEAMGLLDAEEDVRRYLDTLPPKQVIAYAAALGLVSPKGQKVQAQKKAAFDLIASIWAEMRATGDDLDDDDPA